LPEPRRGDRIGDGGGRGDVDLDHFLPRRERDRDSHPHREALRVRDEAIHERLHDVAETRARAAAPSTSWRARSRW
jgi:hypothetical protein